MSLPPNQPLVTIASSRKRGLSLLTGWQIIDIRDGRFGLYDLDDTPQLRAAVADLRFRLTKLYLVVSCGQQRRFLGVMPGGVKLSSKVRQAYERHAGPGAPFQPLAAPESTFWANVADGGALSGVGASVRGNHALAALLTECGARPL